MTYRYKTVKRDGKTKLLHRHLVEQRVGRKLTQDEHVHHENHVRFDNADSNLKLMPAAEHRKEHADARLVHPRTKTCVICPNEFTPHPTKRKRNKTCSKACANKLRSITETATKAKK